MLDSYSHNFAFHFYYERNVKKHVIVVMTATMLSHTLESSIAPLEASITVIKASLMMFIVQA